METINSLISAGLNEKQALIYGALLKKGRKKASDIAYECNITRPLVYKILDELITLDLVSINKAKKVVEYSANHPNKLFDLVEQKESELKKSKEKLEINLPNIVSQYNLTNNSPHVKIYEGTEGIKKVWFDSLETDDEVLTMGDAENLIKNFSKINIEYVKERKRKQIKKRAITIDSPYNQTIIDNLNDNLTKTKLIKQEQCDFKNTIVQIYNNKVSFTTLTPESAVAIIVSDPYIHSLHRSIFNYIWKNLD